LLKRPTGSFETEIAFLMSGMSGGDYPIAAFADLLEDAVLFTGYNGDNAWSLRLQYKPMVRFIWLGALVIAIGGFIAVCDRRYRQRAAADATSPAQADTSAA